MSSLFLRFKVASPQPGFDFRLSVVWAGWKKVLYHNHHVCQRITPPNASSLSEDKGEDDIYCVFSFLSSPPRLLVPGYFNIFFHVLFHRHPPVISVQSRWLFLLSQFGLSYVLMACKCRMKGASAIYIPCSHCGLSLASGKKWT